MPNNPIYSRCSLGKDRWFWVVYRSRKAVYDGEEPLASGYADTAQEREHSALAVAPDARIFKANLASYRHRQSCNQRRATRQRSDDSFRLENK